MIGAAFISDREGHLRECMASFRGILPDDAPATVIDDREHRLGLAGAARAAWEWAVAMDLDYLVHIEEDFRLVGEFDVDGCVRILTADPLLAQVVLKRQPWSREELWAGGIIESHPADYTDREGFGLRWVEHERIFSLNPCVIPRRVLELGWPDGNEAEQTDRLRALGYRFAFFGGRDDPPRVVHVGAERSAGWRL